MKADIVTFPADKRVFKFKNTDTIKLYKRISRLTIQEPELVVLLSLLSS